MESIEGLKEFVYFGTDHVIQTLTEYGLTGLSNEKINSQDSATHR